MKKVVLGLLCLLLVGCTSINQDYDVLLKEYDVLSTKYEVLFEEYKQLEENYKELQNSYDSFNESEDVEISGGFVATVRDVLADNVVDDFTLRLVVLQWFQGDTFVVRVDEEVAKKLEKKTYYFEIEPYVIDKDSYDMKVEEVKEMLTGSITVHNWVKIKDFRDIKDNEGGLNSDFIVVRAK